MYRLRILNLRWMLALFLFTIYRDTVTATLGTTLGTPEQRLRHDLLNKYHHDVRPVLHPDETVNVSFSYRMSRVVSLDTKAQVLIADTWIIQVWKNPYLSWNETEYDGIHTLHISPNELWVPDVVLYDNADEDVTLAGFKEKFKTYVIVDSSGVNMWMSPASFKSSCDMVIRFYPFDRQTCHLTFGSLTFDNRLLKMMNKDDSHSTSDKFVESGDWKLVHSSIKTVDKTYECCKHPYSVVTYTLHFERKSLYHVLYQILPCVVMVMLVVLNFIIPPDSGERISFCITILLSMSVYLLILANSLPETSDDVAMLGVYYMVTIVLVAFSLVGTVVVLRCHFAESKPPKCLVKFAKNILRRKGKKLTGKTVHLEVTDEPVMPPVEGKHVLEIKKPSDNSLRDSALELQAQDKKEKKEQDEWKNSWKEIAEATDRILLIIFVFTTVAATVIIWIQRP